MDHQVRSRRRNALWDLTPWRHAAMDHQERPRKRNARRQLTPWRHRRHGSPGALTQTERTTTAHAM